MKIHTLIALIFFWSISSYLSYLFLFSSFGYFSTLEKVFYKNNLLLENEYLEKENKLLEEKMIQLDKTKLFDDKFNIVLFKFHLVHQNKYNFEEKKQKYNLNFLNSKELYFYLYVFIVILGYIFFVFFSLKTKFNKE